MKSTLKIDYASSLDGGRPVIKIIQPASVKDLKDYPDGDYDVRDRLLSDFLHSPLSVKGNDLFEVITHGNLEKAPDFYVTMIAPLDNDQQFYRFRHNILNKIIPYEHLLIINRNEVPDDIEHRKDELNTIYQSVEKWRKINEFFNWLDETEWATWDEQQPANELAGKEAKNHRYSEKSLRHIYEMFLPDDARLNAFNNTPKHKWDDEVNTVFEGLHGAFDWAKSREGYDYWKEVATKASFEFIKK